MQTSETHEPASAVPTAASAMSPGRLLSKAHHRLRAGLADALATDGPTITVETWTVLAALGEVDGLTQIELGERVDKSRHHLSRLISRLEAEGLVNRVAVAHDKRLKRVVLTADGRRLHGRLVPLVERYLVEAFAGVGAADYAGFIRCLQHIAGAAALDPTQESVCQRYGEEDR